MNKILKGVFFVSIVVFGVFFVARIFGYIQFYSIPTPSNEPTLQVGDFIFATSLKKYERFDFVCFVQPQTKDIYIKRLCGIEGDKIEIREGIFFLNDKNADNNLTLKHLYHIRFSDYDSLLKLKIIEPTTFPNASVNGVYTCLVDSIAKKLVKAHRNLGPLGHADYPMIKESFNHDWTPDNFGPIQVPKDSVFVLGDNRDNSLDSRYFGFVAKKAIKQTAIIN